MRARRVKVPEQIRALDGLQQPGYADAFEITADGIERSAEAWVRSVFEGLPRWQRVVLLLAWRVVLGFRPGPADPAHVLGWRISTATPGVVTLEQSSSLMGAHIVLWVSGPRLLLVTQVRRENLAGRVLWSAAAIVHRRCIPYALNRAVAAGGLT